MASLEQLQMLEEESTTTSGSSSSSISSSNSNSNSNSNSDNEGDNENAITGNPKKRLKLSLGKPLFNKVFLSDPPEKEKSEIDDYADVDSATEKSIVPTNMTNSRSDFDSNESVVLNSSTLSTEKKTLDSNPSSQAQDNDNNEPFPQKQDKAKHIASIQSSSEGVQQKHRQQNKESSSSNVVLTKPPSHSKRRRPIAIKLPPMSSPGLLLTGKNESNHPNIVFTRTMKTAGYSFENRINNPHRGSSVQLVVDDLFDLDVKSNRRFPQLVPKELISIPETNKSEVTLSLPERLMKAFKSNNNSKSVATLSPSESSSRNYNSLCKAHDDKWIPSYSDMIPVSLTFPYPKAYIKKRLEYIEDVDLREKTIVALQKDQEAYEQNPETKRSMNVKDVPPIPGLPDPPSLSDLKGIPLVKDMFGSEEQQQKSHPLFMPQNIDLVNHLDKRCFHITNGRYFALTSNAMSDPHFFGPSAPGYGNLSSSSGLASATVGGSLLIAPSQTSPATATTPSILTNTSK